VRVRIYELACEVVRDFVDGQVREPSQIVTEERVVVRLASGLPLHVPALVERERSCDGVADGHEHLLWQ
jgi:hypothetical protein